VLVPKVSGKPHRSTDLARGTPSGTMPLNRAAHLYLRRSSRHQQPPGSVDPLFMYLGLGPTVSEQPRAAQRKKEGPERSWYRVRCTPALDG
jgi:hypothetical protein